MTRTTLTRKAQHPAPALLKAILLVALAMIVALAGAELAQAQDEAGTSVTADEVNAIASKLYCPVCENIPLDACGTAACDDWRYEIQLQLEAGLTEDQIITDFVNRFGDRAVGVPMNPVLRGLSLITPWVISALVLVLMMMYVFRKDTPVQAPQVNAEPASPDDLRAQLERDLQS